MFLLSNARRNGRIAAKAMLTPDRCFWSTRSARINVDFSVVLRVSEHVWAQCDRELIPRRMRPRLPKFVRCWGSLPRVAGWVPIQAESVFPAFFAKYSVRASNGGDAASGFENFAGAFEVILWVSCCLQVKIAMRELERWKPDRIGFLNFGAFFGCGKAMGDKRETAPDEVKNRKRKIVKSKIEKSQTLNFVG
ncbi:hypothetical protein L596_014755 [Steinernema carpocapsae]|uniref:Uncharacterized protein n=1 Tax=Steinernema carpocapsae TaxID=34508 RepID=A0A4U5NDS2_STECR|nr:hypothetical protein L596_014755 [Steinernema carpocapsae]